MHVVLGIESVPLFWFFLDIMYIQVKSVLRVCSHSCTNKRHDGPLFPTPSLAVALSRSPSSCGDGAPSRVFLLALPARSSSMLWHILPTFDQSSVRSFAPSSSLSSIPMASRSARSIDRMNNRTLSAPTSLCSRSGSRAKRRPNS